MRNRIGGIIVASVVSMFGVGGGVASAQPRVIIEPPVFTPEAEFPVERGYYRMDDGHFYHYDRDRHGWHYGRNHVEGLRHEREREWRERHGRRHW